jgi:hypothetical protein
VCMQESLGECNMCKLALSSLLINRTHIFRRVVMFSKFVHCPGHLTPGQSLFLIYSWCHYRSPTGKMVHLTLHGIMYLPYAYTLWQKFSFYHFIRNLISKDLPPNFLWKRSRDTNANARISQLGNFRIPQRSQPRFHLPLPLALQIDTPKRIPKATLQLVLRTHLFPFSSLIRCFPFIKSSLMTVIIFYGHEFALTRFVARNTAISTLIALRFSFRDSILFHAFDG